MFRKVQCGLKKTKPSPALFETGARAHDYKEPYVTVGDYKTRSSCRVSILMCAAGSGTITARCGLSPCCDWRYRLGWIRVTTARPNAVTWRCFLSGRLLMLYHCFSHIVAHQEKTRYAAIQRILSLLYSCSCYVSKGFSLIIQTNKTPTFAFMETRVNTPSNQNRLWFGIVWLFRGNLELCKSITTTIKSS